MTIKVNQLIDPKEIEIKMSFTNYKLLRKDEFSLKGSCIYFVKGKNEVGKSTVLHALRAAHEIKDDTPQKVSVGESEGVNEFSIPGPDNKMYLVRYEFNDNSTRFVIFDDNGNKISKITEMRDIFRYNHIDVQTFLLWSHSAEGRRKQKEMILNLLPPEDFLQFRKLESEEETLFKQRTGVNNELAVCKKIYESGKPTDEQIKKADTLNAAIKQLNERKKAYEDALLLNNEIDKINFNVNSWELRIGSLDEDIAETNHQIDLLRKKLQSQTDELAKAKKEYGILIKLQSDAKEKAFVNKESVEKLKVSIENGEKYINDARLYANKLKEYDEKSAQIVGLSNTTAALTNRIEEIRCDKEKIITNGEFPVDNLYFDDDGFLTINGFRFDEMQICESDAILLVAQLMCKLNNTPIQIIGDASLLDYEKLDRLYDIAETNGKIMFIDEIDRTADKLVIVGYERHSAKAEKTKTKKEKQSEQTDFKLPE